MPWLSRSILATIVGIGATLAAGCATQDSGYVHGPGPQAGMLEQMRAQHRCVEGEMAKRPDGGRAMPDRSEMAAIMERCPMPMAMRDSMMMSMHGGMQSGESAPPTPGSPEDHQHTPDAPSGQ